MRVLVDTSVWADFFNGHDTLEKQALAHLIADAADLCTCGVIVAEVFQGLRRNRDEIEDLFRNVVFLQPDGMDLYLRAAEVYRRLRGRGVTIRSTIDCLIAVLAEEKDCALLFRDRDLKRLVGSGLLQVRSYPS